jgi:transposase-like protein
MTQKHKPRVYTAEFKREAVRLLETSGKSGAELAQELGISDGSLYTWRKQLAEQGEVAFPGKGLGYLALDYPLSTAFTIRWRKS